MEPVGPGNSPPQKTISYSQVLDLSHPIHPGIPRWPGDPAVEFQTVAKMESEGYSLRRFSMGEHTGTHINAPASFHRDGVAADGISVDSLVAPAVVFNIVESSAANPDYLLSLNDVQAWEAQFAKVPPGSICLLYTGWQRKWGSPDDFLGLDEVGIGHFPGFRIDAVRFLLEERQIGGVGIDTHGVDGGLDQTFAVNRLMLEQPRIVLENLTNLDRLPEKGATLVIGALKLAGGSGSPVSVLALVP